MRWSDSLGYDGVGPHWSTPTRTFRPGERASTRWLAPVATSGLPNRTTETPVPGVRRDGSFFEVTLSPFVSRSDQFESDGVAGSYDLTVERDGELLGRFGHHRGWLEIPPKAGKYRIGLDARREFDWWRYSTRVRSVWTFRSTGAEDEIMPLVLADLSVPSADTLNRVPTSRPIAVSLGLRHQDGSKPSPFRSAVLEISYDGGTWTKLPLRPAGHDRFVATVNHPADQAGRTPSFRIEVDDTAGGRLQQEVTNAYLVK